MEWFEGVKFRRSHADGAMEDVPQDAEMTQNDWVGELLNRE